MSGSDLIVAIIFIVVGYFITILITSLLRPLIFAFEPFFRFINYVQWFIRNPIRFFWKNKHAGGSRGVFLALTLTGITVVWWVISYFITLPLRIINSLYYDILLFSAVSFSDNIDEFLKPKRGKLAKRTGFNFFIFYILTFPFRFIKMVVKSGLYVTDSLLMFSASIVFPTLTMLHGTEFREAGTKITQSGDWKVGTGNYVGTGIYFGITKNTAKHYAPSNSDNSMILARVTLTFCKTIATLNESERDLVAIGDRGEQLARKVKGLYASTEHWREDLKWWEYCILKPRKMDKLISTWRIRPIALIHNDKIVRTYGGFSHYTLGTGLIAGVFSWGVIFFTLIKLFAR